MVDNVEMSIINQVDANSNVCLLFLIPPPSRLVTGTGKVSVSFSEITHYAFNTLGFERGNVNPMPQ